MKRRIAGLLLLSAIPFAAGLVRLFSMSTASSELEGAARFAAAPLTGALHIIGSTAFLTVGAFQFVPALRRSAWHRLVGRVLAVLGVVGALSGSWMVWRWAPKEWDSPLLDTVRLVVALAIVSFIVLSVVAARRSAFDAHEAWATRAYALCAGAGTQVVTMSLFSLPAFEAFRSPGSYAALMSAGWLINALVAEWLLARPMRALRNVEVAS